MIKKTAFSNFNPLSRVGENPSVVLGRVRLHISTLSPMWERIGTVHRYDLRTNNFNPLSYIGEDRPLLNYTSLWSYFNPISRAGENI